MTRLCFVLLAVCAIAAAFPGTPRHRREIIDEPAEKKEQPAVLQKCSPKTPCAWSLTVENRDSFVYNLTNNYCECRATEVCTVTEFDSAVKAYVYRCRQPELIDDKED